MRAPYHTAHMFTKCVVIRAPPSHSTYIYVLTECVVMRALPSHSTRAQSVWRYVHPCHAAHIFTVCVVIRALPSRS